MTEVNGAVNPPIVIAAFGTTSHARDTYDFMDERFQQRFPDHEIHWAFSSRMVKDHVRKHSRVDIRSPGKSWNRFMPKGIPGPWFSPFT